MVTLLEVLNSTSRINDVPNAPQLKSKLIDRKEQAVQDFNKLQNLMSVPENFQLPHISCINNLRKMKPCLPVGSAESSSVWERSC